jgi:hypothetical protein
MPIPIKYTTTNVSSSVRLGNIALGVNAVDYGPSSTTNWANAVPAPNGGYAIYYLSGTNLRMRTAADDATLIVVAGQIMGTTYASVADALSGLSVGGYTAIYNNPPNLVTSGSVFYLDSGLIMSYPRTNSVWYDVSGNASSGNLTNGPTFDSTSNSIVFDGADDAVIQYSPNLSSASGTKTVLCWCYPDSTGPSNDYTGLVSWGGRSNGSPSNSLLLSLKTSAATWYVGSAYWYNDYNPGILAVTKNAWNMVGIIARQQSTPNSNNTTLICGNSNGINYDTGTSSDPNKSISTTNANLAIGSTDVISRVFKGKIARVIIYNRELSQAEIAQNYYQGNIVTSSLVMALDAGNLVSYPGSGTAWTSLTGSNNGTLTNGPTFSSANGGAIVFDGTNDYIDCGTFSQFNGNGDKSLEVWFKPTGTLSAPVVQAGTQGSTGLDFEITYVVEGAVGASTNIPAQYKNLGGIYGAFWAEDIFIPISYTGSVKNNWQQVVLTLSGGNIGSLFYNGTLPQALKWDGSNWSQTLQSQPFTFNSVSTGANQPLYIGRASTYSPWGAGQLYFPGNIAIVRAYNKALSASEVFQNFNAQRNRFNL